ncbi:MAG: hypothetical protein GWN81_24645 [Phycisphaerae bacterium]|nr:hypothetical protein [Phycisphaerae bacterium]
MLDIPDWPKVTKKFFAFKVDGPSLYNIVWSKAAHMGPSPGEKVDVDATVTGNFFDGTAFQGTCTMTFMVEHLSPPPPPSS